MCSNSMASARSCYFELNQTKIKGGCQSGRNGLPHDSKNDLPLVSKLIFHCDLVWVCIGVDRYLERSPPKSLDK